ncbi:MAG TPA: hypothetical protein VFE46_07545 [Pirellulales bacterium]|jgi:hypothetical protein|nr:hypothetical protein [Pirellulales bacterium]
MNSSFNNKDIKRLQQEIKSHLDRVARLIRQAKIFLESKEGSAKSHTPTRFSDPRQPESFPGHPTPEPDQSRRPR